MTISSTLAAASRADARRSGFAEVLLLEDNPADAELLGEELEECDARDIRLTSTDSLGAGLNLLRRRHFDLALIDLNLPDCRGLDTFERLRAEFPELPLIVLTGIQDDSLAVQILRSGAQDFLVKGRGIGAVISRAIRFAIERHRLRVQLDIHAERLARSEARTSRVIEATTDAIIIVDRNGMVKFANPTAGPMFGRQREDLIGSQIGFPVAAGLTELDILRSDGERGIAEMRVVEFPWEDETTYLATLRDITDRKRAHEAIEALNADLEQKVLERTRELKEANKELEAFTYSVSHDLRAPLRHIQGFAGILNERLSGSLDESSQELLDRILQSVSRMQALIVDMLELSRVGRTPVARQRVDLRSMVDEVVRDLAPDTANRRIDWRIGELPTVEGDPVLLRQVAVNLLSNAVKFTSRKETASIEVIPIPGEAGKATVCVRDNGVGFDMSQASRLFGVFQRLHSREDFEGSGIGLANVRRIVRRHGGDVWAEAKPGQGASFCVTLPAPAQADTDMKYR